jgi:hypothetical protein
VCLHVNRSLLFLTSLPLPCLVVAQIGNAKPLVKLKFASSVDPDSGVKESAVSLSGHCFTYFFTSDLSWVRDLSRFISAPEGVSEEFAWREEIFVLTTLLRSGLLGLRSCRPE